MLIKEQVHEIWEKVYMNYMIYGETIIEEQINKSKTKIKLKDLLRGER